MKQPIEFFNQQTEKESDVGLLGPEKSLIIVLLVCKISNPQVIPNQLQTLFLVPIYKNAFGF